ncbi:AraC family transcriptional regulator [Paenibacillus eucommiae]|uniref:AraC-like DNA-binding protein n=1 Tax=Paenibacillus eucommiae TaxID=1355755 RepID=A0ABS4INF7_9BACL|nr:AraC family transcriptional regulator [Paenibacillus eucommiae]MBP1989106.1 AraC-like DNA-binding protein [Paenibacillus eucommiae]
MELQRTLLKQTIVINRIITIFYFEFANNYVFPGERHDFWEFLYVDKGEVEVTTDTERHLLKQGTIIFHKPNEFHSFYAYGGSAPNIIVMTFDCLSIAMKHFENQIISLQDGERNLLAEMIKEGMDAFSFPFQHPLNRKESAPVGCEQMIKIYLEMFLIRLLRKDHSVKQEEALSYPAREKSDDQTIRDIMHYMEDHLNMKVSLAEMSESLHLAKTKLKELFKKKTGTTIMAYFSNLKINRAKVLIREDSKNFTEISGMLGFSSVHHFSKAFKKTTGTSPSEYAKSVKARSRIS